VKTPKHLTIEELQLFLGLALLAASLGALMLLLVLFT
jgi:hypothetical protein